MTFRLSFKNYRLPLQIPLHTTYGIWREREGLLVRTERADGVIGYGEIAPIEWFYTETLSEAEAALRALPVEFTEKDIAALPAKFGCVRFGLEQATAEPEPLIKALRLPMAASLPSGRNAIKVLAGKLNAGFLTFKLKVGVNAPEEELDILDELVGQLPNCATLRLDANGGWDRRIARKWLTRCANWPVEFVEQPILATDMNGLLGLAEDYPVKIALDESVTRIETACEWQERGWTGVFVIKPALAGSLSALAAWQRKTKADLVLSSAIETALGRAAIFRWALAGERTKRALGFGIGEVFGEKVLDGPIAGPLIDVHWYASVKPEELWNALP